MLDRNAMHTVYTLLDCNCEQEVIKYTDGLVEYYPDIDSMLKIATIDFKDNITAKLLISNQGEKIIYFKDLSVIFKKR